MFIEILKDIFSIAGVVADLTGLTPHWGLGTSIGLGARAILNTLGPILNTTAPTTTTK